ncbi:hypothetical protein Plhal304r1_c016g0058561 [Plasmopara halstedii]
MDKSLASYEAAMRDAREYLRRRDLSSQEEIPLYFAWQRLYAAANANLSTNFLQETHDEFRSRQGSRLAPRRGVPPPLLTSFDKIRRTSAQASAFLRKSPSDVAIEMMARRYRREAEKLRSSRDDLINSLKEVEKRRKKVRFRKSTSILDDEDLLASSEDNFSDTETYISSRAQMENKARGFDKRMKNYFQGMRNSGLEDEDDDDFHAPPVLKAHATASTNKLSDNWMNDDSDDELGVAINPVKAELKSSTNPSVSKTANVAALEAQVADWRMPPDLNLKPLASKKETIRPSSATGSHQSQQSGSRESISEVVEKNDMKIDKNVNGQKENESHEILDQDVTGLVIENAKTLQNKEKLPASQDVDDHDIPPSPSGIDKRYSDMLSSSANITPLKSAFQQKLLQLTHAVGDMQVSIKGKKLQVTFSGAIDDEAADKENLSAEKSTGLSLKGNEVAEDHDTFDIPIIERVEMHERSHSSTGVRSQNEGENASRTQKNVESADSNAGGEDCLENDHLDILRGRQDSMYTNNGFTKQSSLSSADKPEKSENIDCQFKSTKQTEDALKRTPTPAGLGNDREANETIEDIEGRLFGKRVSQRIDADQETSRFKSNIADKGNVEASINVVVNLDALDNVLENDVESRESIVKNGRGLTFRQNSREMTQLYGGEGDENCSSKTAVTQEHHMADEEVGSQNGFEDYEHEESRSDDYSFSKKDVMHHDLQSERSRQGSQIAFDSRKKIPGEQHDRFDESVIDSQSTFRDHELATNYNEDDVSKRCDRKKQRKQCEPGSARSKPHDVTENELQSKSHDRAESIASSQRYMNGPIVQSDDVLDMDVRNSEDSDDAHSDHEHAADPCRYARNSASFGVSKGDKSTSHQRDNQTHRRQSLHKSSTDAARGWKPSMTSTNTSDLTQQKNQECDTQYLSDESDDTNVDNDIDQEMKMQDKSVTFIDDGVNKTVEHRHAVHHNASGRLLRSEQSARTQTRTARQSHSDCDQVVNNEVYNDEELCSDEELSYGEGSAPKPETLFQRYQDRRRNRTDRQSVASKTETRGRNWGSTHSKSTQPTLSDKRRVNTYDSSSDSQNDHDDRNERRVDHCSCSTHDCHSYRLSKSSPSNNRSNIQYAAHKGSHSSERSTSDVQNNRKARVKSQMRSNNATDRHPKGIVWPPGMEEECIARLGLDVHHPIAPPGLEHLVTDEQWADYWTWLHWYSSWQMWYLKNDKKLKRRSSEVKRGHHPADIKEAKYLRKKDCSNANWWVDVGSNEHKHRKDRCR